MKKLLLLIVLLFPLITIGQQESDSTEIRKWYIPHYGNLQFAGGTGLLSVEVGYELAKEHLRLGGYYGYLPTIHGQRSINNFGVALTYLPYRFHLKQGQFELIPNINIRINKIFGDGNRTFTSLPSSFPDGYYPPTSIGFFPQFGGEFRWNDPTILNVKSLSFFMNAATNDIYIAHVIPNKYYTIGDLFSASMGIIVRLK